MTEKELCILIENLLPSVLVDSPIERLSGGLINFVWRARAQSNAGRTSLIAKYAAPYLATDQEIPLDPKRIEFEVNALLYLQAHIESVGVGVPQLMAYQKEKSLLLMEDVGPASDLEQCFAEPISLKRFEQWGQHLGHFIALLHCSTLCDKKLAATFNNQSVQQTRYELEYQNVNELLVKHRVEDAVLLGERADALGRKFLSPGICLIMGDLWPRSVLVNQARTKALSLIDWEFVHFGRPAQDIGHLAAHLWMLKDCAKSTEHSDRAACFWLAFYSSYADYIAANDQEFNWADEKRDAALHCACEILGRTFGTFSSSYLYTEAKSSQREAAMNFALNILRDETSLADIKL